MMEKSYVPLFVTLLTPLSLSPSPSPPTQQVCSRCITTKRVSSAVLSIERDSMISVADRRSEGDEDEYSDDDGGIY